MNKLLCVSVLIFTLCFQTAKANGGNFNLSVSTDGKLLLKTAQLINSDGYNSQINNPAKECLFTDALTRYGVYTLMVTYINPASKKASGTTVQLFLKPGDTKLIFKGTSGNYSITGASAAAQKDFEAFTKKDEGYVKKSQQFQARLRQYQQSGNKQGVAQMKDSISKVETGRKVQLYESYIIQHPADDLALHFLGLYSYINMENPNEVKSLCLKMGEELQQTEEMIQIKKDVEENLKLVIGVPAPGFTQADTAGTAITLSSFRGKYVLVDFWASWCKPCRAQNPTLIRLYRKYKDQGFTILGVSLDGKKEAWLKAIHDDKLEWQQVSDLNSWGNAVAKQYKITHVPQSYLLDPQGIIVAKNLAEEDLDETLQKLLSGPK
jgi:peroxiredoxin